MKSSLKSTRLVTLGVLLTAAVLLPLSITKLTGASSTSAPGPRPNETALVNSAPAFVFAAYTVNDLGDTGAGLATIAGITTITHCTFTGNSSAGQAGGIGKGSGVVNIKNSLVAQNTAPTGPDLMGAFTSQGYNLIGIIGSATGLNQTGDQTGTAGSPLNPQLAALANNGGPTATHALLAGSSDPHGERHARNDDADPHLSIEHRSVE